MPGYSVHRLQQADPTLQRMQDQLIGLANRLNKLAAQNTDALEATVAGLQTDVAALQEEIGDLDLADVLADIVALQADVATLEAAVTAISAAIATPTYGVFNLFEHTRTYSSRSTTAVPAANSIRMIALKPLVNNYTFSRVRLHLASVGAAGSLGYGGLYQLTGESLALVTASHFEADVTVTTGIRNYVTNGQPGTITPGSNYYFAYWTNEVGSSSYINMNNEAISPSVPIYTLAATGLAGAGLPSSINISSMTKAYTSSAAPIPECTYFSNAQAALY
jgi:hypothetical protein